MTSLEKCTCSTGDCWTNLPDNIGSIGHTVLSLDTKCNPLGLLLHTQVLHDRVKLGAKSTVV